LGISQPGQFQGSFGLVVGKSTRPSISFPEHARSQVKGGHSSGEIELIQAYDWLTADSTLDFQRKFYACLTIVAKYKQSIWNFWSKI
jgi:hypothetical protein